jgi:hypothetical protein
MNTQKEPIFGQKVVLVVNVNIRLPKGTIGIFRHKIEEEDSYGIEFENFDSGHDLHEHINTTNGYYISRNNFNLIEPNIFLCINCNKKITKAQYTKNKENCNECIKYIE